MYFFVFYEEKWKKMVRSFFYKPSLHTEKCTNLLPLVFCVCSRGL